MYNLRKLIRELIISEVKIPKDAKQKQDIAFKQYFRKHADQQSLQKLRYIHWGSPREIQAVIEADGRSEISTAIHPPSGPIYPWSLDSYQDDFTVGVELEGFVTFASNVDLDSGRPGRRFRLPDAFLSKNKAFQKKTSGYPKRPSVSSIERRISVQKILRKMEENGVDPDDWQQVEEFFPSLSPEEQDLWNNYGSTDTFGRDGKEYIDKNDVLILKAEDLIPTEADYYFEDDPIGLWPEAILDNWKPVKLYIPMRMRRDIRDGLDADISGLVDSARFNNVRIVAHD